MNRYEQYVAFMTILRKEIRRYLRIWSKPAAQRHRLTLYYVIFGNLVGSGIGTMGYSTWSLSCRA